ncbi:unnamed protein product [Prorocentrum cordatum]|uniref:FHA domain-containing protein n=1 Tax=Prorocentrum cordatum TaxID=2364126 RepID=A0ABN9SZR5_9DINO|nr:unnamed protein product [Polarella glacialis]
MSRDVKVIAISAGPERSQQYVLARGEKIVVGKVANSDFVVDSSARGVSQRHAELYLCPPESGKGADEVVLRDVSTNGTGVLAQGDPEGRPQCLPLRKGSAHTLQPRSQVLVPLNTKDWGEAEDV